jgi:signal transduction histidine kinase
MGSINPITLEVPGPDEVPLQAKLDEALVKELVFTARAGSIGLLGASAVIWGIVRSVSDPILWIWFIALFALIITRLVGSIWLNRGAMRRVPYMRVFWWAVVIYGLTGICLGGIVATSCPHLPVVTVLLLLVIMIGIKANAQVTLAGSPLAYVLYVAPIVIGWSLFAFLHPLPGLEHALQLALFLYSVVIVLTVRNVHRSIRNNIFLRLRLSDSLAELQDTQSRLVEASRQAGRSDVATAVLHNVGNVLNSVNVSAAVVSEIVGNLKTGGLSKIADTLAEHAGDLEAYLRADGRAQKLPLYFRQLHSVLDTDKAAARTELQSLMRNIEHIKVIVASQQSHVKPGGVIETFEVRELVGDALKFNAGGAHAIDVVTALDEMPPLTIDRHKVMQIVINLLANARDAVAMNEAGERRIAVGARRSGGNAEITVEDNGCGIAPENLERIFHLGFTTKPTGHGLGLHYSACAARELDGSLRVRSGGVGRGAAFVLVLPLAARAA